MIHRIYAEKRKEHAVEAKALLQEFTQVLSIKGLKDVRILNRYDVEGLSDAEFAQAARNVLSEPQLDSTHTDLPQVAENQWILAVEYLPGQFDQRADSAAQCIQFLTTKERPLVKSARVYLFEGQLTDANKAAIKNALINPVEAQEASLELPKTLQANYEIPTSVETLTGFNALDTNGLAAFVRDYGLAMDESDIAFCQAYFKEQEKREPTITEIRMLDTYWSDHCRHTTFLTEITDASLTHPGVQASFEEYKLLRAELHREDKPMTLMDIATIGARALKARGLLTNLDESDEINACSVKVTIDVNGKPEKWLLQFKNETHNHPTEIEPFGGAATCLGGAIRDPLSGRSYVYQAMRVTGAADPTLPAQMTMKGKLPQRKIVQTAAAGYSAYGNQIGLATGHVAEIYHPGYVAKRMEIGAVLGASPAAHVRRETPKAGDQVILLGGRTGRDGIGGATGSSKSHTLESLDTCGAEVQKGNPPEERKLQRLMRNPEVAHMILRCNDFGAGGVSVAIGELADGLVIDLNAVPKKYEGLDGTELAISESQERMAVVVDKADVLRFIDEAHKENLEATVVAAVTDEPRLKMQWNGKTIVDISRDFINTNGAPKEAAVQVDEPFLREESHYENWRSRALELFNELNIASQKGLVERFDSTIGAGSVLMPFGGVHQLSPSQAMAAKLPVLGGETNDCSLMAWGFDPYVSSQDPYFGAMLAVIHSIAKVIAAGGRMDQCWLTFQEYFERLKDDPKRWGKPFAALLGALRAQMGLGIASIGGKDSMSGSFEHIDVPPTLVSFAVSMAKAEKVVSTEFKQAGNTVWLLRHEQTEDETNPEFGAIRRTLSALEHLIDEGKVKSSYVVGSGGVIEALCKMGFGNHLGVKMSTVLTDDMLFNMPLCAVVLETAPDVSLNDLEGARKLGVTTENYSIVHMGETLNLKDVQENFEAKLQGVFPYLSPSSDEKVPAYAFEGKYPSPKAPVAQPRVLIPVFPGTNCEYDTARAFERAGAKAEILVIRNRTPQDIEQAMEAFIKQAASSQIIAIPGGFSGGDEPEGSAKFITSFLRNPQLRDAVHKLLDAQDGLMLGICNGFQALVKLGLLPYGRIMETDESFPTLTFNAIGRHQSQLVRTRIASNKSPWLSAFSVGQVHTVAVSHGEGRFVASDETIEMMAQNGQIAAQYVDLAGNPSLDVRYNPNMSVQAIEGILSPDGRILGKMAHSERMGENLYKNVPGDTFQDIFKGAVQYFK